MGAGPAWPPQPLQQPMCQEEGSSTGSRVLLWWCCIETRKGGKREEGKKRKDQKKFRGTNCLACPQLLEQYTAQSRCSINVSSLNELAYHVPHTELGSVCWVPHHPYCTG